MKSNDNLICDIYDWLGELLADISMVINGVRESERERESDLGQLAHSNTTIEHIVQQSDVECVRWHRAIDISCAALVTRPQHSMLPSNQNTKQLCICYSFPSRHTSILASKLNSLITMRCRMFSKHIHTIDETIRGAQPEHVCATGFFFIC